MKNTYMLHDLHAACVIRSVEKKTNYYLIGLGRKKRTNYYLIFDKSIF